MPSRTIQAAGKSWLVYPSGRVTQYDRDEFGIVFVLEGIRDQNDLIVGWIWKYGPNRCGCNFYRQDCHVSMFSFALAQRNM